jgi:probable phosphoglycerate mutase
MRFTLYADGGSRGNPGPAGSGAIVRDENAAVVLTVSEFLGVTTNNVAEYTAVLRALEGLATTLGSSAAEADILVRMDSMLVVRQMKGEWKIKHPNMKPLATSVAEAARRFKSVSYEHVYRENNKDADQLANEAMDRGAA